MPMTRSDPQTAARPGLAETFARRPELVSLCLLVVICVAVAVINPAFLSPGSLIDMGRASVVTGLFALGVFAILAAGGIDVSFTAIAALTMYALTLFVLNVAPGLPWKFIPEVSSVEAKLGETKTVFFRVQNTGSTPSAGRIPIPSWLAVKLR